MKAEGGDGDCGGGGGGVFVCVWGGSQAGGVQSMFRDGILTKQFHLSRIR